MFLRLGLEEVDAGFAQRHGDLDVVLLENKIFWPGEKIIHNPKSSKWLVGIIKFSLHKFSYLGANIRRL